MTDPTLPPDSETAAPQAAAPQTATTPRKVKVALAVSVALNLAVIGAGVGMALHGGPGGHGDMVRELGFGPFNDALSPDDRAKLRKDFFSKLPDFRAERQRMQADSAAVLAALRGNPFDPAALDTALGAMREHISQRMGVGSGLMGDFLKGMTPEERAAFADRLEGALRHGPGGGDGGSDGGKGD